MDRPAWTSDALLAVFAVMVAALVPLWWSDAAQGPGAALTGMGQLTGLACSAFALATVLLMARVPLLDEVVGADRALVWHRWAATATVALLVVHVVATTLGYAVADRVGSAHELANLVTTYPDMITATVAAALMGVVTLSSIRVLRQRVPFEAWLFGHWYIYPAMFLAFGHELSDGSSFVRAPLATLAWTWIHVLVACTVVWYRVALPAWRMARHPLRVESVRAEAPGSVSITLAGSGLDSYGAQAGQHIRIRFLTRTGWWQSHPYSLSARPTADRWRITVVAAGDGTREALDLRPGTRAVVSGAHGNLTAPARRGDRVVLIGGGSGIAPLRAVLEDLPQQVDVRVLYRARSADDVLLAGELDALAAARGTRVDYSLGGRHDLAHLDVLAPPSLMRAVPDLAERDAYVCGTKGFVDRVEGSLRTIGVPRDRIHTERFDP